MNFQFGQFSNVKVDKNQRRKERQSTARSVRDDRHFYVESLMVCTTHTGVPGGTPFNTKCQKARIAGIPSFTRRCFCACTQLSLNMRSALLPAYLAVGVVAVALHGATTLAQGYAYFLRCSCPADSLSCVCLCKKKLHTLLQQEDKALAQTGRVCGGAGLPLNLPPGSFSSPSKRSLSLSLLHLPPHFFPMVPPSSLAKRTPFSFQNPFLPVFSALACPPHP